jgi:hypothetical protein
LSVEKLVLLKAAYQLELDVSLIRLVVVGFTKIGCGQLKPWKMRCGAQL